MLHQHHTHDTPSIQIEIQEETQAQTIHLQTQNETHNTSMQLTNQLIANPQPQTDTPTTTPILTFHLLRKCPYHQTNNNPCFTGETKLTLTVRWKKIQSLSQSALSSNYQSKRIGEVLWKNRARKTNRI